MKKTTKKTTKKETFTQEAAEKLYENILEMEDTMQKLGADMDKVRSGRMFYMTNHFDITEDEAKAFLDKMEKKETKAEEKKEDEDEDLYEGEELDEGDTDAINNYMTEMAYDDFLNDLDNEDYEPVGDLWDWWLDNFDLGSEAVYDGEYTQADVDAEGSLYGVAERAYINNKDFIDFDTDKAIATLTEKGLIRKVA